MDYVKVLMLKGEKGDAGTSGDYAGLTNKPQINGITLSGNKTPSDLGLMTQTQADDLEQEMSDLSDYVDGQLANYATEQYVDTAIANAITTAINDSY